MLVELDMIVEAGPALLPRGVDVGFGGQGLERRLVQHLEQRPPARAEMAGDTPVQLHQKLTDSLVQFGEREEAPIPEPSQDPALHDLDADFYPSS